MGKMGLAAAMAAVVWVSACGGGGGGGSPPPPPKPNNAPEAKAGPDIATSIAAQGIQLDGSASTDADGDKITYAWSITSQPDGAGADLTQASQAKPTLQTMAPGEYVVELKVTDPVGASSYDSVTITLTNDPPVPVIEISSTMPAVGEEVTLDASGTVDQNGQPLTYTWTVIQSPPGTLIRSSFSGATVPIEFDAEGDYAFALEVSDGYDQVREDTPVIIVSKFSVRAMNTPFRYASFQPAGGRSVTVMERAMAILDESGAEEASLTLPETARSVGISPDGKFAAVGHAASVSFVDLDAAIITATHPVSVDVGDVIMANDGYAYVFPASDQWVKILAVSASNGADASSSGYSLRAGTHVKIHPEGAKAYGANNGLSPSDIERYDLSGGNSTVSYDSPYHGDFPFCGNLWIAADGATILTRCGVVVKATNDKSTDMTYMMQLQGLDGAVVEASYSAFTKYWYVIDNGTGVKVFDGQSGSLLRTIDLPRSQGQTGKVLFPKFVVADQSSNSVMILAQDHETNPQVYYEVRSSVATTNGLNLPPELSVQKYSSGNTGREISVDASASRDPEGMPLTFAWTLVSEPELSAITPVGTNGPKVRFSPVVAGEYVFEVTASDGERTSAPKTVTVYASDQPGVAIYRMEGAISDAEYSKSLNILAYISDNSAELHLLNLDDFSESLIALPRQAYRVGIAQDGLFAAVSHAGMVSLVDLTTETVIDTQEYSADWGDIVLDKNRRAHLIPNRDQWVQFTSIDFATDTVSEAWGARAGSQVRMHPNGVWVYGADTDSFPSDFEKWDASTFPVTPKGDSPYHGDYNIRGNIWISENGDDLLVAGGFLFNSSDDPAVDMTYLDKLPDSVTVAWADHSSATGQWAVAVQSSVDEPSLDGNIVYFKDTTFERQGMQKVFDVPVGTSSVPTEPVRIFLSHDGRRKFILTNNGVLADPYALQVSSPP